MSLSLGGTGQARPPVNTRQGRQVLLFSKEGMIAFSFTYTRYFPSLEDRPQTERVTPEPGEIQSQNRSCALAAGGCPLPLPEVTFSHL